MAKSDEGNWQKNGGLIFGTRLATTSFDPANHPAYDEGVQEKKRPNAPRNDGIEFKRQFPSTVNDVSHPESPKTRKRASSLSVSILLLVLGLVVLAVAAKTLHYAPHTTEARYFSSSVKIAKYGPTITRAATDYAVAAPPIKIEQPQRAHADSVSKISPAAVPSKTGPKQLRSPPYLA